MIASSPARSADASHARAWAGIGLSLAAAAALHERLLGSGGLAPLLVAAAVGLGLALPAATAEARAPATPTATDRAVTRTMVASAAGAALAGGALPHDRTTSLLVWGVVTLVLLALAALRLGASDTRRGRRAAQSLAVAVPVLAVVAVIARPVEVATVGTPLVAPWAALGPEWSAWSTWLPGAIVVGLLLPLSGTGYWSLPSDRAPRASRDPALTAGAALLVTTGLLVAHALAFESAASVATERTPLPASAPWLALPIGLAVLRVADHRPWRTVAELAGWTAWFHLAGSGAVGWMWGLLVPLVLAGRLGLQAFVSRGGERLTAGAGTVLALAAAIGGFPGVPDDPAQAFGAAATIVVLVWVVGLRRLEDAT